MSFGQMRSQAAEASRRIRVEAEKIARERGIEVEEAVAAVFQDKELLARCHQVGAVEQFQPARESASSEVDVQK